MVLLLMTLGLAMWSTTSLIVHVYSWPAPPPVMHDDSHCDSMDMTECWLPFPSLEFMKRDTTTVTGWRVNLNGHQLPPLKGYNVHMDPTFVNELDGFSTMGSILFYLDGLKEAHEAGVSQLQGPSSIQLSITSRSVTLLLDVNASALIAHSAEIDYLDENHPLVLVFPAKPLQHANHYAVIVFNATNAHQQLLSPSPGLVNLLMSPNNHDMMSERWQRYREIVLPALEKAAPWFSYSRDAPALQMMFDFVTVSEEAQLGPARAVRDATLSHITAPAWGGWKKNHVRVNQRIEYDSCSDPDAIQNIYYPVARTIHAELDVPWFLDSYGPGHRGAVLSKVAVASGVPVSIGVAKFVVHIPCSLRAAALNDTTRSKPLRAIMEYGHGLFFSRQEASDDFLVQMAQDQGYVIMAMDWRGMSIYDLPIVVKTLLSKPRLFQAVRDNLIQGYANKLAMLHFTQNGMLSLDWFRFETPTGEPGKVPTYNGNPPATVFYGISQGGILGAGYVALSGVTKLIDRAALGVPGTPFALIMTRSLDFAGYDALMLLNLYENRHVRVLLALVQMGWDSVEGSGLLATPVREPIPPILLQCGLGDVVVPTIAAEALARGLNASILPSNPRHIFGINVAPAADDKHDGPRVALTEIMYNQEYSTLPLDDIQAKDNSVHVCVRRDPVMIQQVSEFVNSGRVIDVCVRDGCQRNRSC